MKRNANRTGKGQFKITKFVNPSGATAYRVTGWTINGERTRENFKTHGEAMTRLQELEIHAANLTDMARPVITRLSPEQASEAERAFDELDGAASLLTAIRYFKANYREPTKPITITKAFELFIQDKTRQNLRPDSIASLNAKCKVLLTLHGAQNVSEILEAHAKEIIFRPGLSPVAQDNTRRALNCFFVWAEGRGFCEKSPLAKIKAVSVDHDEPQILTLEETRKVLSAAARHQHGVCLPFVAIAAFAAVRPKEIERMTWADVNLDAKTITISGKAAKLRERRIVELNDNLVEWLRPFALSRPAFVGKNFRRHLDAVKVLAGFGGRKKQSAKDATGLKPWTADVLRHGAISYHLAKWQHEGKTALWAGNSPDIIQRHYRGLVSPADAESFWKIAPDAKPATKMKKKFVQLEKAAA